MYKVIRRVLAGLYVAAGIGFYSVLHLSFVKKWDVVPALSDTRMLESGSHRPTWHGSDVRGCAAPMAVETSQSLGRAALADSVSSEAAHEARRRRPSSEGEAGSAV